MDRVILPCPSLTDDACREMHVNGSSHTLIAVTCTGDSWSYPCSEAHFSGGSHSLISATCTGSGDYSYSCANAYFSGGLFSAIKVQCMYFHSVCYLSMRYSILTSISRETCRSQQVCLLSLCIIRVFHDSHVFTLLCFTLLQLQLLLHHFGRTTCRVVDADWMVR